MYLLPVGAEYSSHSIIRLTEFVVSDFLCGGPSFSARNIFITNLTTPFDNQISAVSCEGGLLYLQIKVYLLTVL